MKTNQKVFQVLDLDRTILDTSKLAHYLKEIIAKHDQQLAKAVDDEIKIHFTHHKSFFIFEYIAEKVGEALFRTYIDELEAAAPAKELLLPGAKERIAFAKSRNGWAMGIMTYGSKRDQMIKLKLLGLQLEHLLITDTPYKGEIIASWQLPNGMFQLPIDFGGHIVDVVTLDDDKRIAFEKLPPGAYGQWVTRATLGGLTELKHFSNNVRAVPDLNASITYLKTKF